MKSKAMENSEFINIFKKLYLVMKKQDDFLDVKERFTNARNDEERVTIVLNQLLRHNMLPYNKTDDDAKSTKCASKSIELRCAGNQYLMKDPSKAHMLYTQSVAMAPYPILDTDKSEELAAAFASRAGLLFINKNYKGCLSDIEQALLFDYPDNLKYKLYERQGKCYQKLGNESKASISFKAAISHLHFATSLPNDVVKSAELMLENLCIEADSVAEQDKGCNNVKPQSQKPCGQHKHISCASDCLAIKQNSEIGFYMEATMNINPGDIVIVEEPYGSWLWPSHHNTHCFNCLKRCDALIPCTHCSEVMYCSDACRKVLWDISHKIECPVLSHILKYDGGEKTPLALRVLIIGTIQSNGLKNHYDYVTGLEQDKCGKDAEGSDKASQYKAADIQFLLRHTEHRSFEELLKFATISACLLNCLESHSEIFDFNKSPDTVDVDLHRFVGGLLMRYMQLISCNAYSIADVLYRNDGEYNKQQNIGAGIYPIISRINHSCAPNVASRYEFGRVQTVMALLPIKKGDEILVSYNTTYAACDIEERKDELESVYFFNCSCIACIEMWPMYNQLPIAPTFICSKCHSSLNVFPNSGLKNVRCFKCKKKNDILPLELSLYHSSERLKVIIQELISHPSRSFIQELSDMMKLLFVSVQYPSRIIFKCQESIRMNFVQLGNFYYVANW